MNLNKKNSNQGGVVIADGFAQVPNFAAFDGGSRVQIACPAQHLMPKRLEGAHVD